MSPIPGTEWLSQLDEEIADLRRRERELLNIKLREEQKRGVYRCVVCRERVVFPEDGEDTCSDCLERI